MRFTIKLKLALAFSLLILLSTGMSVMAVMNLSSLNTAITDIIQGPAANLRNSSDLSDAVLNAIRNEKNAILNTDPRLVDTFVTEVRDNQQKIETLAAKIQLDKDADIQAKISQFLGNLPAWRQVQEKVIKLAIENTDESNRMAGELSMSTGRAAAAELLKSLSELNDAIASDLAATDNSTNQQYAFSRNLLIGALGLMFVLSVAVAFWIALGISNGLKKIQAVAEAVAIGDLDQNIEIKTNDEIKDLVNTINVMTGNLRNTADIADQIANGNLTVEPKPLSGKDTLGLSLQSMVERLRGVVADCPVGIR